MTEQLQLDILGEECAYSVAHYGVRVVTVANTILLALTRALQEGRMEIGRLQIDNQRLREALRWYADESRYPELTNYIIAEVDGDGGRRARQALGEEE